MNWNKIANVVAALTAAGGAGTAFIGALPDRYQAKVGGALLILNYVVQGFARGWKSPPAVEAAPK